MEEPGLLIEIGAKSEHKGIAVAAVDRIDDAEALRSIAARAAHKAASRRTQAKVDVLFPPPVPPSPEPADLAVAEGPVEAAAAPAVQEPEPLVPDAAPKEGLGCADAALEAEVTEAKPEPAVAPVVARIAASEICMNGSELLISMREPRIMAVIPPAASRPCDVTLTSAMNKMTARTMRRSPA